MSDFCGTDLDHCVMITGIINNNNKISNQSLIATCCLFDELIPFSYSLIIRISKLYYLG